MNVEEQIKVLLQIDSDAAKNRKALNEVSKANEEMIGFLTEVWGIGVDHPADSIRTLTAAQEKIVETDQSLLLSQITAVTVITMLKKASGQK